MIFDDGLLLDSSSLIIVSIVNQFLFFFINDTIISLIINLKIIELNEHVYPFLVSNNF